MSWCQRHCQEPVSLTLGCRLFIGGQAEKGLSMGRIPDELRKTIAANIRAERVKNFPGRGGGKKCAEAFSHYIGRNVSPQQWSPWERGMRTPDESRLQQIADFFDTTVENLRRNTSKTATPPTPPDSSSSSFPHVACTESAIIWQLQKVYTGMATDGRRLHVSLNFVLSEEKSS